MFRRSFFAERSDRHRCIIMFEPNPIAGKPMSSKRRRDAAAPLANVAIEKLANALAPDGALPSAGCLSRGNTNVDVGPRLPMLTAIRIPGVMSWESTWLLTQACLA